MPRLASPAFDQATQSPSSAPLDPSLSAKAAGLQYVSDALPGIRRIRSGRGFRYVGPAGESVRDPDTLARIRALAIPPAWRDVWICPIETGHLQAVGRDARNRKQYRYHPRWHSVRDEVKYGQMIVFARALPLIRARVEADLSLPGLPRRKVLATVVRLLETTLIRVGNEEYARKNHSYGLTTLRTRHVEVRHSTVVFQFRGKSGVLHSVTIDDRRVARILKKIADLPGEDLFHYVDEHGELHTIQSADVNDYLREISGQDFTAKHFRTWAGTVRAACVLQDLSFASNAEAKRNVTKAIAAVAGVLGNTKSVCRKCYVHPEVINSYLKGIVIGALTKTAEGNDPGLRPDEAATLALLESRVRAATPFDAKDGDADHAATMRERKLLR